MAKQLLVLVLVVFVDFLLQVTCDWTPPKEITIYHPFSSDELLEDSLESDGTMKRSHYEFPFTWTMERFNEKPYVTCIYARLG